MKNREIGMLSSAIFGIGVFLPIMNTPFGYINFFTLPSAKIEGIIFLAMAVCIFYFFYKEEYKKLKLAINTTAIIVVLDFIINYLKISVLKKQALSELSGIGGGDFNGITEFMVNQLALSWGWLVMMTGVVGMICAYYCRKTDLEVVETPEKPAFRKVSSEKVEEKEVEVAVSCDVKDSKKSTKLKPTRKSSKPKAKKSK